MELIIQSNRGYLKFTGRFGLLVKGVKERIFSTFQKCGATIQLFNSRACIETVKFSIHKLCRKFVVCSSPYGDTPNTEITKLAATLIPRTN